MSRLRLALGAGALVVAVFAACASGDGEQSDGSGGLSTPGGGGAGGSGSGTAGSSPGGSSGAAGSAAGDGGAGKGNPDASMFPDGSAGAAGSGAAGGGSAGSAGSSGTGGSGGAAGGATGGSAGASAGSAGAGGGCVPACTGKQCGPDGCSGQCGPGCSGDQTCDGSGACVTSCKPTWTATVSGVTPGRAALDPTGALYVVGAESDKPWVGAFDRCAGTSTASAKVPIGASGRFIGVSLSPTSVYAVGTADGDGSFAKLTKGSLAVELSGPLVGSNEQDETWDIAQTPKGNVWATGTANVPAPAFWMIQATATQGPCGFGPIDGKSVGRAIALSGGSVFVAGARNDQGLVARFDDASCFATSPCSCVPAQTSTPIQLGAAMTELRGIVIAGSKAYVAGYASDTTAGDVFAVLARIDLASLTVESSFTWNPTPQIDAFVALAADATQVYAAGGRGWAGEASFATSTGVLVALPLAFGPSTQQAWNAQPSGARVMWGVATGDGAVYAAGATATGGLVTKCAAATGCPLAAAGERGNARERDGTRVREGGDP